MRRKPREEHVGLALVGAVAGEDGVEAGEEAGEDGEDGVTRINTSSITVFKCMSYKINFYLQDVEDMDGVGVKYGQGGLAV